MAARLPSHQVVAARLEGLELPAEQAAVELLGAVGVARRDLEPSDAHSSSFLFVDGDEVRTPGQGPGHSVSHH